MTHSTYVPKRGIPYGPVPLNTNIKLSAVMTIVKTIKDEPNLEIVAIAMVVNIKQENCKYDELKSDVFTMTLFKMIKMTNYVYIFTNYNATYILHTCSR